MIVAIDGPAGSGKSTVALALAQRLGFLYLDTGAMYRALTWLARLDGVEPGDGDALARLAREHPVSFDVDGRVSVAGEDVTAGIRERQRALGAAGDAVIEGRDIGSVVAPDAEVKVFLVAHEAERARRRTAERPGIGADALAEDLRRR